LGRILFRKLSPRSRWLHTVGMYAEGGFLYLFWLLVRPLSPERASATGRTLIRWLGPKTHKHRQVRRNLERAFPELNDEKRESLARDVWGNFGAVMAEYPHLHTLTYAGKPPHIDLVMDEDAREILENKQPAIYVTAHLGNWELVGAIVAKSGIPFTVIYSPQKNPLLERMINNQRHSVDIQLIAKDNGIRKLIQEFRSGHSIGLISDQRVDTGEPVSFFGCDAQTTTSPARLALKLGCPLVPVQIERIGKARFRAVFHHPLVNTQKENKQKTPLQVTTELNRMFEDWIRNQPDQWVCIKRRWKTDTCHSVSGNDMPCA